MCHHIQPLCTLKMLHLREEQLPKSPFLGRPCRAFGAGAHFQVRETSIANQGADKKPDSSFC